MEQRVQRPFLNARLYSFRDYHVRTCIALFLLAFAACDDTKQDAIGNQSMPEEAMAQGAPSPAVGDAFGTGGGVGGVGGGGATRAPSRGDPKPGRPGSREESFAERDMTAQGPLPASSPDPSIPSMIIRNGQAAIEVDSLELALAQVRQLAQKLGGQVANSSIQTGRREIRSASVVLRIPSAQFDAAMSGLTPIGKVESQNVASEDVTEQYVDMAARTKNAKRLEERLINLLATRTGKLEDVLAVERELARVREEIERYEGQLRYLRTRAAISTLTLNLHEPYPILAPPGGSNVIAQAFRRAWRNFVGLIASGIAALGILIPVVVGVLVFLLVLRKLGLFPRFGRRPPTPPAGSTLK